MAGSRLGVLTIVAVFAAAELPSIGVVDAQTPAKSGKVATQSTSSANNAQYEDLFDRYLNEARKMPVSPSSWMTNLAADPRARYLNDLLTILVEENVTASGSADSTLDKNSKTKVVFPAPLADKFGKLFPNETDTAFAGAGSTNRSSSITALLTARVSEVLPNGDMVIEGVREVDVNGDNLLVVLTGVVRPVDVAQNNMISSTRVGQLRIRSIGRGMIKDSLSPGWLVRILNKVF